MSRKPVGLQLEYPCRWQYRLIGEDREAMLAAIREAVDEATAVITEGNVSSGGRYRTLQLDTTINDEAERLRLHRFFSGHPAIRIVL